MQHHRVGLHTPGRCGRLHPRARWRSLLLPDYEPVRLVTAQNNARSNQAQEKMKHLRGAVNTRCMCRTALFYSTLVFLKVETVNSTTMIKSILWTHVNQRHVFRWHHTKHGGACCAATSPWLRH